MDLALLVLRLVFGALLAGHGAQKLFGWFRGDGLTKSAAIFAAAGFTPARPMVVLAGCIEVASASGLALGLVTPLSASAAVGTMIVACSVHWPNGLWAADRGVELPLLYLTAAACLALAGPGRWSLDHVAGLTWDASWIGFAALLLAASASAPVIVRRQLMRRRAPANV